jgi:predicted unusual protein kinase regulating ubiquinone biosynthesis (AarF/ABC1/UbiB family)
MGAFTRALNLAALPVSTAGRIGKAGAKIALGADRAKALEEAGARSIEQAAIKLAQARGPAMKFGQVIALMGTTLPAEQAAMLAPLARLYEDAKPRELNKLNFNEEDIPGLVSMNEQACAAASLGQVHKGRWVDGREVAVKIQYPDARSSVKTDMMQIKALAPLLGKALPNLDVKALVNEHGKRLEEELDYRLEAAWMKTFKDAWHGTSIFIPEVLYAGEKVLVTEWIEGQGVEELRGGAQELRNSFAQQLLQFTFESPKRVGASHADAHPGNYRLLPGGELGVLDFGSVANGSGVFTQLLCNTLILGSIAKNESGNAREEAVQEVARLWVESGLAAENVNPEELNEVLDVDGRMLAGPVKLDAEWMARAGKTWGDPGAALERVGMLRFPPEYLLEHRALGGALALAARADAQVDLREITWNGASEKVRERWKERV